MIHHIEGVLSERRNDSVIIDVGGVGVEIFTTLSTLESIPTPGSLLKLYTSLAIRENDISLYGFGDTAERALFELLLSVKGVGPKMAIGILSSTSPDRLQEGILSQNATSLSGVKGVGKKTAERLIVELKDKIGKVAIESHGASTAMTGHEERARHALVHSLGFSDREARRALSEVLREQPELTTEDLIKQALSHLS